jgi:Zinc finger, C2H2 type
MFLSSLNNRTGTTFKCIYCDSKFEFSTAHNLQKHVLYAHKDKLELKFQCNACDLKFINRCALSRHKNLIHTDDIAEAHQFKCEHCKKSYISQKTLNRHIRQTHKDKAKNPEQNVSAPAEVSPELDELEKVSVLDVPIPAEVSPELDELEKVSVLDVPIPAEVSPELDELEKVSVLDVPIPAEVSPELDEEEEGQMLLELPLQKVMPAGGSVVESIELDPESEEDEPSTSTPELDGVSFLWEHLKKNNGFGFDHDNKMDWDSEAGETPDNDFQDDEKPATVQDLWDFMAQSNEAGEKPDNDFQADAKTPTVEDHMQMAREAAQQVEIYTASSATYMSPVRPIIVGDFATTSGPARVIPNTYFHSGGRPGVSPNLDTGSVAPNSVDGPSCHSCSQFTSILANISVQLEDVRSMQRE